ncbi:MAG TPA: ParB N-terminal domain-containing protein, partial [Aquamicrobium sp.]|nr:ParB N-terminal domain-containing protein [Aquamicrobium sp.]
MSKPNKLSRWKIVWIPTSMIDVVWAKAQRGYDAKKARAIADTFDPDLLDPIVVSLPNADGKHHCIDGQHRLGAVRLALGDDQSVPCRVVAAADPQRAADIFVQLQTRRTAPAAIDRFIVSVTAGYEVETAVNGILRDLGYKASRGKTPGCLGAIDCCVSVYRRMGGDTLRLALATIKANRGLNAGAVDSGIVN